VKFVIEDLFVCGIGLDLVGATLLVVGLLERPSEIAKRIRNEVATYAGSNPYAAVSRSLGYSDTVFGLACLLLGFTLQAIAYLALFGGVGPARTGSETVVTALVLAGITVVCALLLWRLVRRRVAKRIVVGIAGAGHPPEDWNDENVAYLHRLGVELGAAEEPGEARATGGAHIGPGPARYVERVFGIEVPDHLRHQ